MADPVTGVLAIFKVNTGSAGSPTYTAVTYQRNCTITREVDTAEITNKDGSGWKDFLPTLKSWGVEFDGLADELATGYAKLKTYFSSGLRLQVQLLLPDATTTLTGYVIMTNLTNEAAQDGAYSYSASFQGCGALTEA